MSEKRLTFNFNPNFNVIVFICLNEQPSKATRVKNPSADSDDDHPLSSEMPRPSDRKTSPIQPDPFIQLLSDRYVRIKNKRARRQLEHVLLNEIGKVEEEEEEREESEQNS